MYTDLERLPNTGTVTMTIDAKGRVSLPTVIREWVSKNADGKLTLDPDKESKILLVWAASAFHAECKLQMEDAKDRVSRRELARTFKNACDLNMDASGRIRISPGMRDDLHLQGKVSVYASYDHFEICHPDNEPDNDPDLTDVTS